MSDNIQKPISRLKRLLGLSSAEEVAEVFGLKKTTTDNLNTGRASRNLIKAYQIICQLLERFTWEERHSFLPKKKEDLSQADKAQRIKVLKIRISVLIDEIQNDFEKTQDNLTRLLNDKSELDSLTKS